MFFSFYTIVILNLEKQQNCKNVIELIHKYQIRTWTFEDKSTLEIRYSKSKIHYIVKVPIKPYIRYFDISNVEITFYDENNFLMHKENVKLKEFAKYGEYFEYSGLFKLSKSEYNNFKKARVWVK